MTPREAATIIGCSPQQVRTLIRTKRIKARKVSCVYVPCGYRYAIRQSEVQRYARKPQKQGWPRGQSYELIPVERK